MPLPEVLIVGRPNVGKSTLFNRLVGKSVALVDDQPGSTRDLKSHVVEWEGTFFTLTDSGGWVPGEKESIAFKVGTFLEEKIHHVAALLLVVDAQDGITAADVAVARHLRTKNLPSWLIVNKADRFDKWDEMLSDFRKLGFDHIFPISASHGLGIDDFLDSLIKTLPAPTEEKKTDEEDKKIRKIAILGKPNVGKSSLVNAILGEKRLLVDDLPGTTHDAIPVIIETGDDSLIMVDTAGIRAAQRQDTRIEQISVDQTLYELQTCQLVLFLVDGEKGITHQDVTIGRIIHDAFRPVIVLINKWDVHPKGAEQARAERITKRELRNLFFAPVLFISAKTGQGLENILPLADELYKESCAQVPTSKVNQALQTAASKQPPPFKKGHQVKIFYGYQRPGHPPVFEVFVNHPESVTPSYLRYLEAELRKEIGMEMTPMQIVFKEKADKREYVKKGFKRNFDPNIKEREKRYKKTHRKDTKK